MVTSGHQTGMGRAIKDQSGQGADNQHMVQLSRGDACKRNGEGKNNFKEGMNINHEYNELRVVMFADLRPVEEGWRVTVIDIGDQIGFCGQVQVRADLEKQIFYGLTLQNYSGLKRKLQWRYRMWSIQAALQFLINTLMAGLRIEQGSHHALT